jgi:DNA-binding response OmpR family regulator
MVSYLEPGGYRCITAATFHEALRAIDRYDYYCVLVDLNLPDGDGLKIIRLLKENQARCGIIVISARDTLSDRILGLDTGADDYLVKPFDLSELNARIQSLIRRTRYTGQKNLTYKELTLDPDSKSATISGEPLELTRKEFDMLLYLITNKNRVITKDAIAEHIWGDSIYGTDYTEIVYTHMKNLRKKLQVRTGTDWIQTVYGTGYRISEEI